MLVDKDNTHFGNAGQKYTQCHHLLQYLHATIGILIDVVEDHVLIIFRIIIVYLTNLSKFKTLYLWNFEIFCDKVQKVFDLHFVWHTILIYLEVISLATKCPSRFFLKLSNIEFYTVGDQCEIHCVGQGINFHKFYLWSAFTGEFSILF